MMWLDAVRLRENNLSVLLCKSGEMALWDKLQGGSS